MRRLLCVGALGLGLSAAAAPLPDGWPHVQTFAVADAGLIKISLPVDTLDAARPSLADVRLYDDEGRETPYWLKRAAPVGVAMYRPKSFEVALQTNQTILLLQTGLPQPVDGVWLETPAADFIKAAQIEGSLDGRRWRTLGPARPLFRQPDGAAQLQLTFEPAIWPWLCVTVDDQRSPPVPFTNAVVTTLAAPVPAEAGPATITERQEEPGVSRLTLDVGAANLTLADVELETAEPLFTRSVAVWAPEISGDVIRERPIGAGLIFRVAVDGQPVAGNLKVPLETRLSARELVLLITNGDSPPLPVTGARVERRPVELAFYARAPGAYHLLTGNRQARAPRYDLATLNLDFNLITNAAVALPPLADNPGYRPPGMLPGLDQGGAPLDLSAWRYRRPLQLAGGGAQQLEPGPEVLARAQPGLADLRFMRGTNQLPYLVQHTSLSRALTPAVTATNDVRDRRFTRWIIHLPYAGLPLARLACTARTPFFERTLTLYEELTDERGDKHRQTLGGGTWRQTPEHPGQEFSLTLSGPVSGGTLFLETANGDNPPPELEHFAVYYPVTRLLFLARTNDALHLYYGNPQAGAPSYDLRLVAGPLLAADKSTATLAGEELLHKTSGQEHPHPGAGGVVFWGMLAVVVAGLLVIIARLLPKP